MSDQEQMLWDMIRERDDYRSRAHATVQRIEVESGQVIDHLGNLTGLVLPIESWRSIRAMLQREVAHD